VCASGLIGLYELDFQSWNKDNVNPRSGKHAKGITGAFMQGIFKQVARDARKVLGRGPMAIEVDRASSRTACATDGTLGELFDEVEVLRKCLLGKLPTCPCAMLGFAHGWSAKLRPQVLPKPKKFVRQPPRHGPRSIRTCASE